MWGRERLPNEGNGSFALVFEMVVVGVLDNVDVGGLGEFATFVSAVPGLVDEVGLIDELAAASVDMDAIVGDAAGMVEAYAEVSDGFVVAGRGEGVGDPEDGVFVGRSGCFGVGKCGLRCGGRGLLERCFVGGDDGFYQLV